MTTQTPSPIRLYQPPAPKPKPSQATRRTSPILDDAEVADRARKIALHSREIGRLQAAIYENRNEINRLTLEIEHGSDLDGISIGICGLCGFSHVGECLS